MDPDWEVRESQRRRRQGALHALCLTLAGVVAYSAGSATGWMIYSGRFIGGVFVLSLFFFEVVFMAVIPSIFEARRMRRVAEEDARRATRHEHQVGAPREF